MKGLLQILGLCLFIGLNFTVNGQSLRISRYIMVTDTVPGEEGGVLIRSTDDAEQENDEIDTLQDDDIDVGWEGEPDDQNILTCGLRFRNIAIPQGATIDSAYLILNSHEAKDADNVARITIVGEATDDAQTFTEDALISDRPATTASLLWETNEAWGLWTFHRTPDLSGIVQEIVNREGWESGNSLAFIMSGEDQGPAEIKNTREFESFENIADPEEGGDGQNHPERRPELVIFYSVESAVLEVPIIATGGITVDEDTGLELEVSSDDAEQENDEIDSLLDDDIDAGWEGEPEDQNILTAGLRFQNIFIPKGAVIDSAFIEVTSHEAKDADNVARINIYGEATDNAQTFTEDALITDRPSTNATVLWESNEAWGLWTDHRLPDVKTIVQEVIDRDGWEAGNAIAFVLQGEDQGPAEIKNTREWESYENIADPEEGGDGMNHPERRPRLIIYYSSGASNTTPIAALKEIDANGDATTLGQTVTIQGIVHSPNFRPGGLTFPLIDANGDGINIFSSSDPIGYENVQEGDELIVTGEVGQFRGLTQIVPTEITLLSSGNPLVTPTLVETLGEETESQLVTLNGLTIVDPAEWTNEGSGFNVQLTDGTNAIQMRIDADTDIFGTEAPTEAFNLTGIGGQFDQEEPLTEGYQIFPRYLADISLITSTVDKSFKTAIQLYPNPAESILTITTTANFDRAILTNALGQKVLELAQINGVRNVDVSNFAKGVYNLTFVKENRIWTESVILK